MTELRTETPAGKILTAPPAEPDKAAGYLFYLHGLIVEEAGIRPKSEEHGYYEYEAILQSLAGLGLTVISEARPKGTEIKPYAEKIVGQINALLGKGVPAGNITVVGASKGGAITSYISSLLQQKEVRFVFLAGLFEWLLKDPELQLWGKVLSIHDSADKLPISPELYFERSPNIIRKKSILTDLELGHGLIYQPRPVWMEALVDWLAE